MYEILNLIIEIGVPAAVMAYIFRRFEQRQDKKEQEVEEKTDKQERLQIIILDTLNANIEPSEATARAVQRIPDAHCNGDMHAALDYAAGVKHKQKEFLAKQGVHAILDT